MSEGRTDTLINLKGIPPDLVKHLNSHNDPNRVFLGSLGALAPLDVLVPWDLGSSWDLLGHSRGASTTP